MAWEIEYTDEFEGWWNSISEEEQAAVRAKVLLLREDGPELGRPHADTLAGSKYPNLKELRIQHAGDPYRVLFAFDPRRVAILLLGGRKADEKWYRDAVPRADKLYADHLETLRREGLRL
jgi:hypothetical protein